MNGLLETISAYKLPHHHHDPWGYVWDRSFLFSFSIVHCLIKPVLRLLKTILISMFMPLQTLQFYLALYHLFSIRNFN